MQATELASGAFLLLLSDRQAIHAVRGVSPTTELLAVFTHVCVTEKTKEAGGASFSLFFCLILSGVRAICNLLTVAFYPPAFPSPPAPGKYKEIFSLGHGEGVPMVHEL